MQQLHCINSMLFISQIKNSRGFLCLPSLFYIALLELFSTRDQKQKRNANYLYIHKRKPAVCVSNTLYTSRKHLSMRHWAELGSSSPRPQGKASLPSHQGCLLVGPPLPTERQALQQQGVPPQSRLAGDEREAVAVLHTAGI